MNTSTGASVTGTHAYGSFSISDGHAKNIHLENGGLLAVLTGGTATDTTIDTGGRMRIENGTVLYGTTTVNEGGRIAADNIHNEGRFVVNYNSDNDYRMNFTGSGEMIKNGSGMLNLSGNISLAGGVHVNAGGLVIDSQNFKAPITTSKNTILSVKANNRLSGNINNSGLAYMNNGASIDGTFYNNGSLALNSYGESHVNNAAFGKTAYLPSVVTLGNYNGKAGSVISMGGVLAGDDSRTDKLIINGNASGQSQIFFRNENGSGAQTLNGINLISVSGNSDAEFTLQNRVVAGGYDYSLQKGNISGTDMKGWYLTSKEKRIRPESGSYTTNIQLANTLFSLSKEDRLTPSKDTSMWMRVVGGQSKMDMSDGQSTTTVNHYVQQLGGDIFNFKNNNIGDFKIGVMGGYAYAKGKTHNQYSGISSRNTLNGSTLGIYGSWEQYGKDQQGAYADAWLQYNWFSATVKGEQLDSEKYQINGFTGSLEAGYNFKLNQWDNSDGSSVSFWMQPHIQGIWMGVNPDSHTEKNGTRVKEESGDNVQTKLGVKAFWKIEEPKKGDAKQEVRPYFEVNWINNSNLFSTGMNEETGFTTGTRNAGEAKVGIIGQANDKLSIDIGLSHQSGNKGYQDTKGTLSLKYNF